MMDGGLQSDGAGTMPDPGARCAELQAALDRVTAKRDAWAQELFESNRFAAELIVQRQRMADDLASVTEREAARANQEALPHVEAAWRERDMLRAERDAVQGELVQAVERAAAAEAMLRRVTTSTSWRLTAPMRSLLCLLRGVPR